MPRKRPTPKLPSPAAVSAAADRATITAAVQGGRRGVREAQQELALAELRRGRSLAAAARAAGISRMTLHRWREDAAFNERVDEAYQEGSDFLEDALVDLGLGDAERGKSAQFLPLVSALRARRPERWRENLRVEQTTTHKIDGAAFDAQMAAFFQKTREAAEKHIRARIEAARAHGFTIDGEKAVTLLAGPPLTDADRQLAPPGPAPAAVPSRREIDEARAREALAINPADHTADDMLRRLRAEAGEHPDGDTAQ